MSRDDITRMMRESGMSFHLGLSHEKVLEQLGRFAALVRADERWKQSKRRGVLAFCPYTGRPRHPSDIASDPHGILILAPDQPLRARGST